MTYQGKVKVYYEKSRSRGNLILIEYNGERYGLVPNVGDEKNFHILKGDLTDNLSLALKWVDPRVLSEDVLRKPHISKLLKYIFEPGKKDNIPAEEAIKFLTYLGFQIE